MSLKKLFLTFSVMPMLGLALPTAPQVQAGDAAFKADHAAMDITCQDKTVINWDTFSVESHETLRFLQSADSTVLNRVTGHITGGDISRIMGTLESEGNVYILNPQGIFIGKDATINVGSLIASTLNITNADFFNGKEGAVAFSGDSQAKVLNLGTIKASSGDVHVIAYAVENGGTIEAAKGQVTLNACQEAILQPANNKRVLIKAKVDEADYNPFSGSNSGSSKEDSKVNRKDLKDTGVSNTGVIKALEARLGAEGSLYKLAINQSGHIEAKTLVADQEGGKIFLIADKGIAKVDGTLIAKANNGEKGGYVEILAEQVGLEDKAVIDIEGKSGGGIALIGSDYRGRGTDFNSQHTYIGPGAKVLASAQKSGDGGKIIFWGDESVRFLGKAHAKAGENGGDGGFIEVSSPKSFVSHGDLSAGSTLGKAGKVLFDPADVTISGASTDGASETGGDYTFSSGSAIINATEIENLLNTPSATDVEIDTASGSQSGDGVITVGVQDTSGDILSWSSHSNLTLTTSGANAKVVFLQGVSSIASGATLIINAPQVDVGLASHANTEVIDVQPMNLEIHLNANSGSVNVYAGDGKNTDLSSTISFLIDEGGSGSGVSGGSVLVESGSSGGYANIITSAPLNINLNDGGASGTIECNTSGSGGARIYANGSSGEDLTVTAPNTDVRIINSGSGPALFTADPGGPDISVTAKSLHIESTGSGDAGIAAHSSSTDQDVTLNISGAITLNATASGAEAYIAPPDGDIILSGAPDSLSITSTGGGHAYIHAKKAGATARDIIWNQSGMFPNGITISATGASAEAYITADGQLKLGTTTNRIAGKVDIDAANGGTAYIGDAPSASSSDLAALDVYATGDITIDTSNSSGANASHALIRNRDGSFTTNIHTSGGGVALTNAGYSSSSVLISSSDDLNVTASGAITLTTGSQTFSTTRIDSSGSGTYTSTGSGITLTSGDQSGNEATLTGHSLDITTQGTIAVGTRSVISATEGLQVVADGVSSDITVGSSSYIRSSQQEASITAGRNIELSEDGYIESGNSSGNLTATAGNDVVLNDTSYMQSQAGNALVTAGREVILNDTTYLDGGPGNLTVVTDNNYPAPSADPNAGIGNLKMSAGTELKTDSHLGEIRVYAGFDENNRADIDDDAKFNNEAYSTLKGELDTEDDNNRFYVYYNVNTPHTYNAPATFYYKETTPVETIQEGNVEGAREVASSAIPSFVISSYLGDTLMNFIRKRYVTNSKAFHNQYGRAKVPLRRDARGNKTPTNPNPQSSSAANEGNSQEEAGVSGGLFGTNTRRGSSK